VVVYVAVSWPQQHLVILLVNYEAIKSIGANGVARNNHRDNRNVGEAIEN